MPKGKVESNRKVPARGKRPSTTLSEEINGSINSDDETAEVSKSPNGSDVDSKNGVEEMDEELDYPPDFSGGMSKLLEKFSSDLHKTMVAKKRKLEQFTQESVRSTTRRVLETNKAQSVERSTLMEHFNNQLIAVLHQGEAELDKMKESEDKLHKAVLQQQKHVHQLTIAHSQRLKVLKNLGEEFCKGMKQLETNHVEQYSAVHGELRKEMALLQKKILMDIQQQEMMNVRKHLKQIIT